jgi:hypothetical protein
MATAEHIPDLQVSLRRLFFAVTTIALGFGARGTPLPEELSTLLAMSPTLFWSGVLTMYLGYWVFSSQNRLLKIVGALITSFGAMVSAVGAIIAIVVFLFVMALLVTKLRDWVLRPTIFTA